MLFAMLIRNTTTAKGLGIDEMRYDEVLGSTREEDFDEPCINCAEVAKLYATVSKWRGLTIRDNIMISNYHSGVYFTRLLNRILSMMKSCGYVDGQ